VGKGPFDILLGAPSQKFIKKFAEEIVGTLGCFDRGLFKGHLPISGAAGMAAFLSANGVLFKGFRSYVQGPAQRLKEYARQWAEQKGEAYYYIQSKNARKEDLARRIATEDGISEGLVCVLAVTESCLSFRLQGYKDGPHLMNAKRKCLCLYFYGYSGSIVCQGVCPDLLRRYIVNLN